VRRVCYRRRADVISAGAFPSPSTSSFQMVDETAALVAGNKVSSAHLSSFRNNGAVTIRNVLRTVPEGAIQLHSADAASAGIAARLLDAPAICWARNNKHDGSDSAVTILLPLHESEAEAMSRALGTFAGGGSLAPGDVFATATTSSCAEESNAPWRTYQACGVNDSAAVFVDKLCGSRGETPTTVIQWSKGTVHTSSSKLP